MPNIAAWNSINSALTQKNVVLIAVSKTKPIADIQALYEAGQLDFGENYVQELTDKQVQLPQAIRWHFIGHLQSNKVKYIATFIYMIHSVDSLSLLQEINKQAAKHNRIIKVLLQIYVAAEDTKFGMNEEECNQLLANFKQSTFNHVNIAGVMGMASNTDNKTQIANEFARLFQYFNTLKSTFFASDTSFCYCSMGMSSDYEIAMAQGSNMVRIGSLLFGNR